LGWFNWKGGLVTAISALIAYLLSMWQQSPWALRWIYTLVAAVIGLAGYILFKFSRQTPLAHAQVSGGTARSDALRIVLGTTQDFIAVNASSYVTRRISVCIENIDPQHFISNCKVYAEINGGDNLLADSFSLHPLGKRFIPVVFYTNAPSPTASFIRLCQPPSGGGFFAEANIHQHLPLAGSHIKIKAICLEAKSFEILCKVSVDDSGVLQLVAA
jgi:hypothetical protein